MHLKLECELLIRPTTTRSSRCRSSRRTKVVLPEPMSPVSRENAACDSKLYSSIVMAIACWRDGYRNSGSGVSENGFILKPKWRSYIVDIPQYPGAVSAARFKTVP